MKTIVRLGLAAVAAIMALGLDIPASRASGNAPWCAVVNIGTGSVIWDCRYRSIEECQPNVISGNRGTCNINPALGWSGGYAGERVVHPRHRKRHVHHH